MNVVKILFRYKWYLSLIVLLMILEPSINSVLNFWLQRIFTAAQPGAKLLGIIRMLTVGFLLWLLKRILSFASGMLRARYICNAKRDLKHSFFSGLMDFETANLAAIASSGTYISLFTNDINLFETRFLNQVIALCSGLFSLVIMGTSFVILNAKLAAAIISFGIVAMLVPLFFSKPLNEKSLTYLKKVSLFTQRIQEYLNSFPTIKNYSVENAIEEHFNEINTETEDARFQSDYILNLANTAGQLLSWFMQFIAVGLGLVLVVRGEIKIATVLAAQAFASDLAQPLQDIIMNINSIRSVKDLIKRFDDLVSPEAANIHYENTAPVRADSDSLGCCDVEFRDVCLEIGGKRIIDQFSFTFEAGKKYLIVGLNGSGKSSLFRALKKWFNKCRGEIRVGGIPVTELENSKLSKTVSYLNEKVSLFSGTILDNITLYRDYSPKHLEEVIRSAQIHLNLDRVIGGEGTTISSGEQRRIEIARSLLDSVGVMIFDEVVSTLDIETAYEIERMAMEFTDKTVIFISHNFSGKLIRKYDEILVMDGGRLADHGSYESLRASSPYFRRICEIKFGELTASADESA